MSALSPSPHKPLLSVIIPIYNESEGLPILFSKLHEALQRVTEDYEILCINDGSKDDSLAKLKSESKRDSRIRYISLSRNFGKEAALTAGLHHARGQAIIPFDADLQDPPDIIPDMVAKWREGYKVVLATRRSRTSEGFLKRITAKLFYKIIGKLATISIPENTGDFRLMDAQVVEVLRLLPERTRFMKGLFAWVGFTTTTIYFERLPRLSGRTKFNVFSLWSLAKDGMFSFTTLPLRLTTYAGLIFSCIAILYGAYLTIRTLLHGVDVPGYPSLMTAILFIGGIQMISIGILGEYVGRIYRESKQRPLYVIEESNITAADV